MADLIPMREHDSEKEMMPAMTQMVSAMVRDMLAPLLESMGRMLQRNTEAMEQIASAQQLASQRISDLEKRVRLQTPVSRAQEKYIQDAVKERAMELLRAKSCEDDRKAVTQLTASIRKKVLAAYGVGSLRELPGYDYETVLKRVEMWNDMPRIQEIVRASRARQDEMEG